MIVPDRAGIGRSDPVPDRSFGGYAAEATALADTLGIDRFAVVGYSAGAVKIASAGAVANSRGGDHRFGADPA